MFNFHSGLELSNTWFNDGSIQWIFPTECKLRVHPQTYHHERGDCVLQCQHQGRHSRGLPSDPAHQGIVYVTVYYLNKR